jgi:hypothetical protein
MLLLLLLLLCTAAPQSHLLNQLLCGCQHHHLWPLPSPLHAWLPLTRFDHVYERQQVGQRLAAACLSSKQVVTSPDNGGDRQRLTRTTEQKTME